MATTALSIPRIELPDGHHWVDPVTKTRPSVAERLQRCGGPMVITQVDEAAFKAAKAAATAESVTDVLMAQPAAKTPARGLKRKATANTPQTEAAGSSSMGLFDPLLNEKRDGAERRCPDEKCGHECSASDEYCPVCKTRVQRLARRRRL